MRSCSASLNFGRTGFVRKASASLFLLRGKRPPSALRNFAVILARAKAFRGSLKTGAVMAREGYLVKRTRRAGAAVDGKVSCARPSAEPRQEGDVSLVARGHLQQAQSTGEEESVKSRMGEEQAQHHATLSRLHTAHAARPFKIAGAQPAHQGGQRNTDRTNLDTAAAKKGGVQQGRDASLQARVAAGF